MLGTHSEPRRGQMSHVCDISLLRVSIGVSSSPHKKAVYLLTI